jgi:hypothetical protein
MKAALGSRQVAGGRRDSHQALKSKRFVFRIFFKLKKQTGSVSSREIDEKNG